MTLTEYMNQKQPARWPVVNLEGHEFNMLHVSSKFTLVEIPLLHIAFDISAVYMKFHGCTGLWTLDGDGNPKQLSCFRVLEPLKITATCRY